MNALLPAIEEMKGELGHLKEMVNKLSDTVTEMNKTVKDSDENLNNGLSKLNISLVGLSEKVCDISENQIALTLAVNHSMMDGLKEIETRLEEHMNLTTTELVGLHTPSAASTSTMPTETLTEICDKIDILDLNLVSFNTTLTKNMDSIKKDLNMIESTVTTVPRPQEYMCGGTGGWRRVVYLNMTDPNTNCSTGWQLTGHSKRTCGRVTTGQLACDSVFFPVCGGCYTRVCGSIRAYQYAWPDGFETYHIGTVTTIDGAYVSGISLTHGNPRQHIWTFACGNNELLPTRNDVCPCDASFDINVPSFVNNDYFCESGLNETPSLLGFHANDPLWDGAGCSNTSSCCSFNNPPYFIKELPSPTSDPIEARLCEYNDYTSEFEDTPIEFIELYVQ